MRIGLSAKLSAAISAIFILLLCAAPILAECRDGKTELVVVTPSGQSIVICVADPALPGLENAANIVTFTPTPTDTPTATPTDTPTATNTPDPCDGKADGTTCDAGMDGVVLTCVSQTCGACVPTGLCSGTPARCAFNEDCPALETCIVSTPSPRYVDNGNQTITDRQTCRVWEMKTGTFGSTSLCPGGANCGDPHDVNNQYQWSSTGTLFDGATKTLFLDALNDVAGGGISCFAGHCDWRLASSGGRLDVGLPTGERAELESILTCGGLPPLIDPIFGPTASSFATAFYYSSSTVAPYPNLVWAVGFGSCTVNNGGKTLPGYVRAVRGGS